jgi:hypothetical protein
MIQAEELLHRLIMSALVPKADAENAAQNVWKVQKRASLLGNGF